MKKVFLIGWKDLTLAFRDRAALTFMLLAPFLLTLGLGFVTGAFSGSSSSGVSDIPVIIVNQDGGQLGNALAEAFLSPDLAEIVKAQTLADPAAARQQVDADKAAAALIIPPGFSARILPVPGASSPGPLAYLELYTNPTRPTGAGVIQTIVEGFLSQVEVGRIGGQVAVTQLLGSGLVALQDAAQIGMEVGTRQGGAVREQSAVQLKSSSNDGRAVTFNILAFMAPGMALFFLMYTVTNGGRSLLVERNQGTLPRLLISPTTTIQVLGGKVLGTYLTGVAQLLILIITCALLFQLEWGDPLGVLALVLAAVAGAMGWGMLITALAKTPGQIGAIGSAVMLTFGILGGSFFSLDMMPEWYRWVSKITPNAWGVEGFTTLALGGGLGDILSIILALLVMGGLLFAISVFILNRRNFAQA